MLYAKVFTSPYAHAKITGLDTSPAEALSGVRDILRYDDPDIATDNITGIDAHYNILTLPGISDFYQHPMGIAVVADSEEICDRALKLIKIEWEERPFVLDLEESLKPTAPKIMSDVERLRPTAKEPNTIMAERVDIGDIEKGFADADRVIEYKIRRSSSTPAGVEAMVCVAQWRGEFLDLWVHHQYNEQKFLSSEMIPSVQFDMFDMDDPFALPNNLKKRPTRRDKPQPPFAHWSKITLTYPYQGSWFGGVTWLAYSVCFIRLAVVLARRAGGKPVKLLYDESQFYCNGDDSGSYTCKVGAKKDGTITAYHWHTVGMRNPAIDKTPECTRIHNIRGTQEWAFTNQGHHQCFRHGAAACVPHNMMFDRVAAEFGLDPTEVALKNDGCDGHPWDWVTQYQKDNGFPERHSLKEVIDLGKKAIGWDQKWHPPGTKKLSNEKMHGLGFMSIHEWQAGVGSGWAPPFACLILRDGKVTIVGTRCDMGVDSESGYRQCVASELGLKYEDTVIQERRSDNNTYHFPGPGGSFGTTGATPQLVVAARGLRQKILQYAVIQNNDERDWRLSSRARSRKTLTSGTHGFREDESDNRKTVAEVANEFWNADPAIAHPLTGPLTGLESDGKPDQRIYFMARQSHFIEVAVDTETGHVEITDMVCVNDVGHVFNPQGAMGQQYGGALMGLGRSATEEKIFCPRTGVGLISMPSATTWEP
jgi:CO/xanthine dehydrogenase Mo-binding subunit